MSPTPEIKTFKKIEIEEEMKMNLKINLDEENMFDLYLQYAQEAKEKEQEIIIKYDKLKEELVTNLKQGTIAEMEEIEKTLMKEYSPIKFHNMLTSVVNKHKNLDTNKEQELKKNKEDLDKKLAEIIETVSPITEMYKIIGMSNQNNNYLCRVWFTLVPIEKWKCVPGDPIRVEWLHIPYNVQRLDDKTTCVNHKQERTGPGPNGLCIPQFDAQGRVTSANATYPITKWGANSNQVKWWDEWIAKNRPC